MKPSITFTNNQIIFITQDIRQILRKRIINPYNRWDFLFGWNYQYELDNKKEVTSINGFSLKYYYEMYKEYCENDNFIFLKIEDVFCRENNISYNDSLPVYIKKEIIKNPEILDCLVDYGYEKDKEWIKYFDERIFEKIEKYKEIKEKNKIYIEYQPNKKGRRTSKKDKRFENKDITPTNMSNQERKTNRLKQLRRGK